MTTVNDRPATVPRTRSPVPEQRSTAELVKLAAEQISTLVRDELKLAQLELARKGKRIGVGVGLFGGAGIIVVYGVGALVAAAIMGLAAVMPAWLSALTVGVVLFAIAVLLALVGVSQVKRATPPLPIDTVASVKADIETITNSIKDHHPTEETDQPAKDRNNHRPGPEELQ